MRPAYAVVGRLRTSARRHEPEDPDPTRRHLVEPKDLGEQRDEERSAPEVRLVVAPRDREEREHDRAGGHGRSPTESEPAFGGALLDIRMHQGEHSVEQLDRLPVEDERTDEQRDGCRATVERVGQQYLGQSEDAEQRTEVHVLVAVADERLDAEDSGLDREVAVEERACLSFEVVREGAAGELTMDRVERPRGGDADTDERDGSR